MINIERLLKKKQCCALSVSRSCGSVLEKSVIFILLISRASLVREQRLTIHIIIKLNGRIKNTPSSRK
ncbi:hypothetical protein D3C73_1516160 [compost metagenome]